MAEWRTSQPVSYMYGLTSVKMNYYTYCYIGGFLLLNIFEGPDEILINVLMKYLVFFLMEI